MYTFFILILFLWYFWYFYFSLSQPVKKPNHGSPNTPAVYTPRFESIDDHTFQFHLYNRVVWEHEIPHPFLFLNQRIVEQDVCQGTADGGKVLATGFVLYQFLKDHPEFQPHFPKNILPSPSFSSSSVLQKGHIFYFTCREQRIWKLQQCPSGRIFVRGHCEVVQPCTNQEDGTLLPIPKDVRHYFRCEGEKAISEECPQDTFFLLDACRSQKDITYYCQFYPNQSFLLEGSRTRVDCIKGKPVYTTCPVGHKFFTVNDNVDANECEPITCEGQPDGFLVSTNQHVDGVFAYYSSYMECLGGRLSKAVECPSIWDAGDPSNLDNLLQLPMVFDGQKCAIPTFCTNVEPSNEGEEIIVPVYEWRRHVANWKHASLYDHLEGYRCGEQEEGSNNPLTKRKRVAVAPGEIIDSKRFKRESGCMDRGGLIPVSGDSQKYFDCTTQIVATCPEGETFNGTVCQPLPLQQQPPFRYQGRDLFQLDSLSHDNWIIPWKYASRQTNLPVTCHTPNDVHIELYNVCSHPDCTLYPYLSQFPSFSIHHPEGYRCRYDSLDRHIKKEENLGIPSSFNFWSQHRGEGECEIGQHLKTGHFVWDSLFYATCDPRQPFVLCPSSETPGIIKIGSKYACKVPPNKQKTSVFGDTSTPAHFELNEIERIQPTVPNQEIQIKTKGPWILLPAKGKVITEAIDLTVREPVILHYRYRVTHPPDVVFHYQEQYKSSTHGGGFVCKRSDFTHLNLNFPEYKVQAFVSDF